MDEGFFKFWRLWYHGPYFQDANLWKVFCWCWMRASHKSEWVLLKTGRGSTTVKLERGQFLFGRNSASKALKMPPRSVYKRMAKLELLGIISQKRDTHYSIITLCNYELFQGDTRKKGQARDTYNELKNPKNCNQR